MVALSEFIEANTINIQQQSRLSCGKVRTKYCSNRRKNSGPEFDYFSTLRRRALAAVKLEAPVREARSTKIFMLVASLVRKGIDQDCTSAGHSIDL
jgi:hypothetical protein